MKTYTIVVNNHGIDETYTIKGNTLIDALERLLEKCEEEDNTGVFFELENADLKELENDNRFFKVNDYGIVIESIKEN